MSLHRAPPVERPDDVQPSLGSSISCAQDSFTVDGATTTVMFMAGEIDMQTEDAVLGALARLIEIGSSHVVVDLTGVCFCSVGGFGMLVETARSVETGGGHFCLVSRSSRITRVQALLWPDRNYSRHATVASAIATIRARRRATRVGS